MDDSIYMDDFNIIAMAGTSKSASMQAIEYARAGEFDKAEALIKEAEESFAQAHDACFKMLSDEANGEHKVITIVSVHAQDHLTMATMANELAKEFINLYKLVYAK